jgi:hypothetical protein
LHIKAKKEDRVTQAESSLLFRMTMSISRIEELLNQYNPQHGFVNVVNKSQTDLWTKYNDRSIIPGDDDDDDEDKEEVRK